MLLVLLQCKTMLKFCLVLVVYIYVSSVSLLMTHILRTVICNDHLDSKQTCKIYSTSAINLCMVNSLARSLDILLAFNLFLSAI